MNVERLNDLSIEALYALAEKMGLDLPPALERIFVVEALIEAFQEDSDERKSSGDMAIHIEEKKFSGSELDEIDASLDAAPCIARRYNETVVHWIPRDPEWAFAFWDVKDEELNEYERAGSYGGLFLRVVRSAGGDDKAAVSFDVPVNDDDDHWYLQLPEQDRYYRLDLCVRIAGKAKAIAHSNVIRTPRAILADSFDDLEPEARALAELSGLSKLRIQAPPERHPSRIMGGYDD